MILVGNSRGGGQDLASHLLKTENEHVEIFELKGFASDNLHDAFKEAHALSRATKAKKYLFSLSLNPPEGEKVGTQDFADAIERIEKKLGLEGQPRAVVFHEKEGRRHCHAVWSRIDGEELKAIPMDYSRNKLQDCARELYLEHGWAMPKGFLSHEPSDPKNFTLAEWQQANRTGQDARKLKAVFQESWAISDSRGSFSHALSEHGLILAKGDRRAFVAVDRLGEVYAIARWTGKKTKDVKQRLGDPADLPSVEEAQRVAANEMKPAFLRWRAEMSEQAKSLRSIQATQKGQLVERHRQDRLELEKAQAARHQSEQQMRQRRFNKGLRGLWDRLRGAHGKIKKRNEHEALEQAARERREKDDLIFRQLEQRAALKRQHQDQLLTLREENRELIRSIPETLRRNRQRSAPSHERGPEPER